MWETDLNKALQLYNLLELAPLGSLRQVLHNLGYVSVPRSDVPGALKRILARSVTSRGRSWTAVGAAALRKGHRPSPWPDGDAVVKELEVSGTRPGRGQTAVEPGRPRVGRSCSAPTAAARACRQLILTWPVAVVAPARFVEAQSRMVSRGGTGSRRALAEVLLPEEPVLVSLSVSSRAQLPFETGGRAQCPVTDGRMPSGLARYACGRPGTGAKHTLGRLAAGVGPLSLLKRGRPGDLGSHRAACARPCPPLSRRPRWVAFDSLTRESKCCVGRNGGVPGVRRAPRGHPPADESLARLLRLARRRPPHVPRSKETMSRRSSHNSEGSSRR